MRKILIKDSLNNIPYYISHNLQKNVRRTEEKPLENIIWGQFGAKLTFTYENKQHWHLISTRWT